MADAARPETHFVDTLKTVLAGMLGVRRRETHEAASARIRPAHIIVAGVVAAALFVAALVTVARLVAG
jgi:hypothetical protein